MNPVYGIDESDRIDSTKWSRNSVPNVSVKHDNHTGRWLSTFRPSFDSKQPNVFLTGSMDRPRRMEVFNVTMDVMTSNVQVKLSKSLEADYLGSVCSRNCFHPSLDIVVGGNSSGRVHVFR